MKKMLGKAPKVQDEDKKMAKMKALKELRDNMSEMAQDGLGKALSMKKVTVAAPDTENLKEGLDKAKDLVNEMPNGEEKPEDENEDDKPESENEDDMSENEDEDYSEDLLEECDTPEEIDELMKKLEEKKKALLLKK